MTLMSDITRAIESLQEDFDAADKMVDEIYDKYFAQHFKRELEMYDRFRDADLLISDEELEWIITSLPMELFAVSYALTQFKQHNELVKLKIKQRKGTDVDDPTLDAEYKIMSIIYTSVIARVEQEISFSKELIMGAKKVWDARRKTDHPSPINEVNTDLPDYVMDATKNVNF